MKTINLFLFLGVIIFVTGCASDPNARDEREATPPTSGNYVSRKDYANYRNRSTLKEYNLGRTEDPANPDENLLVGGKMISREKDESWNFTPSPSDYVPAGEFIPIPTDITANPMTAEFEQEIKEQQKYTKIIIEQNAQLTEERKALMEQFDNLKQIASQHEQTTKKLQFLEEEIQKEKQQRKELEAYKEKESKKTLWQRVWNSDDSEKKQPQKETK